VKMMMMTMQGAMQTQALALTEAAAQGQLTAAAPVVAPSACRIVVMMELDGGAGGYAVAGAGFD
jgi:hypothetical protein